MVRIIQNLYLNKSQENQSPAKHVMRDFRDLGNTVQNQNNEKPETFYGNPEDEDNLKLPQYFK